jgi:transposase InsO family protein
MGHGRRHILWFGVTAHPTAEWIANQVTEACGWKQAPRYLIRDRDGAYGEVFIRRLRSIGIRDRPTSPRYPWQNGYAERLIGSIRQECLDRVIVFSERHLRHLLLCYMKYYNGSRTHLTMHRSRAPSIAPGTFFVAQSWADCITNMAGFNLRQAQAVEEVAGEAFWIVIPLDMDLGRGSRCGEVMNGLAGAAIGAAVPDDRRLQTFFAKVP